jgi:hypothetical protein
VQYDLAGLNAPQIADAVRRALPAKLLTKKKALPA